jgi:hypothetical protein
MCRAVGPFIAVWAPIGDPGIRQVFVVQFHETRRAENPGLRHHLTRAADQACLPAQRKVKAGLEVYVCLIERDRPFETDSFIRSDYRFARIRGVAQALIEVEQILRNRAYFSAHLGDAHM